MTVGITTDRLLLRPLALEDIPAIQRVASDPRVALKTARIEHPYPADGAERFVRSAMAADPLTRPQFGMAPKDGSPIVGVIGGHVRGTDGIVGYWLDPEQWGRGYGFEALRALLDHMIGDLGVRVFTAHTFPDNAASIRLLQKAGFRSAGVSDDALPARGPGLFRTLLWRLDVGTEGASQSEG